MSKPAEDHTEVEWQFSAADVQPAARWLESAAVPGFRVVPGPTKELEDTYLDTADWRLHRAGFTCRVRAKGDGAELTLKSMADASAGIRSRREVTEPLDSTDVDSIGAAGGPAGTIVRTLVGRKPLTAIFTIRNRRQLFYLGEGEERIGEIALDSVSIPLGLADPPARFSRVEVEVEQAALERARRFVDVMVAAVGLGGATTSKFEAALLATGQRPLASAPDLGPVDLSDRLSSADFGYAILRRQFRVFLANEGGTRLGEDIEALHDMRVAARRLRAAISAFAAALGPRMDRLRQELGWVAAALGEVRDLDVQLERMAEWREHVAEAHGQALDAIEALLLARRSVARKRMLAALDSRRYEIFVERFSATLRRGPASNLPVGRLPVLATAPALVDRRYRRFRKFGDRIIPSSPPDAYHALRIDAKKLRYALEFVGSLYGKQAIEFSQKVTLMQDLLGQHQDAEVAVAMLREMAATRRLPPATILAMGAISERYRIDAIRLRSEFPRLYRQLGAGVWKPLQRQMTTREAGALFTG